jgi:hypothetical protein
MPNPSPLRTSISPPENPSADNEPAESSAAAEGNLPGGRRIAIRAKPRSKLLRPGTAYLSPNPCATLWGNDDWSKRDVEFTGKNHRAALEAHPSLRHLEHKEIPEDLSEEALLNDAAERARASRHADAARRRLGISGEKIPLLPSDAPHFRTAEEAARIQSDVDRWREDNKKRAQEDRKRRREQFRLERPQRLRQYFEKWVADLRLPMNSEWWNNADFSDISIAAHAAGYFPEAWPSPFKFDDPDSEEAMRVCDKEICSEWGKGDYDGEKGFTLLQINAGNEWIAWAPHERKLAYNLTTGEVLPGSPSEVYKTLKKDRPWIFSNLEKLFIGFPAAAQALQVFGETAPETALRHLNVHTRDFGIAAATIDFDEFGRLLRHFYSASVFARYDTRTPEAVEKLGQALDGLNQRFLLTRLAEPTLQETSEVFCYAPVAEEKGAGARRKRTPRLYDARSYTGMRRPFEAPSSLLKRYAAAGDPVGVFSISDMDASFAPDQEALSNMAAQPGMRRIAQVLQETGIRVDSPEELARYVGKTYVIEPEPNVDFIKRYIESRNLGLPSDERIEVTLESKWSRQALPALDGDLSGYRIQYRRNGQPVIIAFQTSSGTPVFMSEYGMLYSPSQLDEVAKYEGWQNEGPVSIMRLQGLGVPPLQEVAFAQPPLPAFQVDEPEDNAEETQGGKPKRPISISSVGSRGSRLSLQLRPAKKERLDTETADE